MLFSGVVKSYECPACEARYTHTIPTSLLPILVVTVVASAFWTEALLAVLSGTWAAYLLALVISALSIPLAHLLVTKLTLSWTSSNTCPSCGAQLKPIGGGFIDGGPPSIQELIVYLTVIVVPLLMWAITGP